MTLVDDVVEAHGGLALWRRTAAVSLQLSSGGLAFAAKGPADRTPQPACDRRHNRADC
jgi:hypothetical protein